MVLARGTAAALILAGLLAGCGGRTELDAVPDDTGYVDDSAGGAGTGPGALPDDRPEAPITGTPVKAGDVAGSDRVPLHLYIIYGSCIPELFDIHVWIENTYVLGGDFLVTGSHNFELFSLQVPSGELKVRAEARRGDVEFEDILLVPAERWGYLYFSCAPGDGPPWLACAMRDINVPPAWPPPPAP